MAQPDRALLAYLTEYVSPSGTYYGGVLVVNERGLPREFRHTDGVKPSRLQTTLYGDSLLSCLGTDSLGPSLCNALQTKPNILLIDERGRPIFGDFVHDRRPAAYLSSMTDPEANFGDRLSPLGDILDAVTLIQPGTKSGQVFFHVDEGDGSGGRTALELAQHSMNLRTPFERVRSVLAQVAEIEEQKAHR